MTLSESFSERPTTDELLEACRRVDYLDMEETAEDLLQLMNRELFSMITPYVIRFLELREDEEGPEVEECLQVIRKAIEATKVYEPSDAEKLPFAGDNPSPPENDSLSLLDKLKQLPSSPHLDPSQRDGMFWMQQDQNSYDPQAVFFASVDGIPRPIVNLEWDYGMSKNARNGTALSHWKVVIPPLNSKIRHQLMTFLPEFFLPNTPRELSRVRDYVEECMVQAGIVELGVTVPIKAMNRRR